MTYIAKPKFQHPGLPKNELGFTHRDYEGKISTLCAGCGHDTTLRRGVTLSASRWSPIARAMKRAVIGVPS